jgi:hypothetical protein
MHIPAVHMLPAQHGWPMPPQVVQFMLPGSQARPVPQKSFGRQHGCPMPPHAAQLLFRHSVSGAVHVLLAQHAWLASPHVPPWQPPFVQTPPFCGQFEAAATQVWPTQQPPFAQLLPPQHACPPAPHWAHMPWLQASAGSLQ